MNGKHLILLCWVVLSLASGGCAAFTLPVAGHSIPVREVPEYLLGKPREAKQLIPLTMLRQPEPKAYVLGPGDILGVWIEGVLGERNQSPPIQIREPGEPPSIGFPIPVREDGTISLPLVEPLKVEGLTLLETEKAIIKAFTIDRKILKEDVARISVTMQLPRSYQVLVVREDSSAVTVGAGGSLGGARRGSGTVVALPAYKNDVMTALTETGGLPGLDAENEVIILRGGMNQSGNGSQTNGIHPSFLNPESLGNQQGIVRIPLRLSPEEPITFKPEDIILHDGDIVYVPSRDSELYYTAGILGSGQFILPRDYDLDVIEALALSGAPLFTGSQSANNLSGSTVGGGLGTPTPSQLIVLRKTAEGKQLAIRVDLNRALVDNRERILVQPSDILILQETLGEATFRYVSEVLTFNFAFDMFETVDAFGGASFAVP